MPNVLALIFLEIFFISFFNLKIVKIIDFCVFHTICIKWAKKQNKKRRANFRPISPANQNWNLINPTNPEKFELVEIMKHYILLKEYLGSNTRNSTKLWGGSIHKPLNTPLLPDCSSVSHQWLVCSRWPQSSNR